MAKYNIEGISKMEMILLRSVTEYKYMNRKCVLNRYIYTYE